VTARADGPDELLGDHGTLLCGNRIPVMMITMNRCDEHEGKAEPPEDPLT